MQAGKELGYELYLGGDKDQHIGWVEVHSGVIVINYKEEFKIIKKENNYLILPLGDSLKTEYYGAYDRSKHKMPY